MQDGERKTEVELIDVGLIDEHPDNEYLFGMPQEGIESLKEAMMGADGSVKCDAPILLWDMRNGRYMVYSGHMRLQAFIRAGGKRIPSLIRDFPEKETERRRALIGANMHGRNVKKVDAKNCFYTVRQIEYLAKTLEMEGVRGKMKIRRKLAGELHTSMSTIQFYHVVSQVPQSVKERLADGRLNFSVAREFAGIDEELARRIFDIFDQAQAFGEHLVMRDKVAVIRDLKKMGEKTNLQVQEFLHTKCVDKKIEGLILMFEEWAGVGYANYGYIRRRLKELAAIIESEVKEIDGSGIDRC